MIKLMHCHRCNKDFPSEEMANMFDCVDCLIAGQPEAKAKTEFLEIESILDGICERDFEPSVIKYLEYQCKNIKDILDNVRSIME